MACGWQATQRQIRSGRIDITADRFFFWLDPKSLLVLYIKYQTHFPVLARMQLKCTYLALQNAFKYVRRATIIDPAMQFGIKMDGLYFRLATPTGPII